MAKYDPLRDHLYLSGKARLTLSFSDIESLVGHLPQSASDHQAWWANDQSGPHVQAHAWMAAGYRVASVDQHAGFVTFERDRA
ncbi:MAG: hypothetical protein ACF8NJ_01245 [Phycisphaerales bacterium JB038]